MAIARLAVQNRLSNAHISYEKPVPCIAISPAFRQMLRCTGARPARAKMDLADENFN
jgi:hypothetical protein